VVSSELLMVAQTVSAGLADREVKAVTMDWPTLEEDEAWEPAPCRGQDVGLVVSDLATWERLRSVWRLCRQVPLPWVVITNACPGPMWGAALEAGACVVLPSSTGLRTVRKTLTSAARGTLRTDPYELELLVQLWAGMLERRAMISEQVRSLTPREHEVLTMLHAGEGIPRIAQLLGVSPVTVRSQVKALMRKLDVNSQLGAVAALDDLLTLEPWDRASSSTSGPRSVPQLR
jgi:DNA-binding NarL/FixJ family response regulator